MDRSTGGKKEREDRKGTDIVWERVSAIIAMQPRRAASGLELNFACLVLTQKALMMCGPWTGPISEATIRITIYKNAHNFDSAPPLKRAAVQYFISVSNGSGLSRVAYHKQASRHHRARIASMLASATQVRTSPVWGEAITVCMGRDFKEASQKGLVFEGHGRSRDHGNWAYTVLWLAVRESAPRCDSLVALIDHYTSLAGEPATSHALSLAGDVIEVVLSICRLTGPKVERNVRQHRLDVHASIKKFLDSVSELRHRVCDLVKIPDRHMPWPAEFWRNILGYENWLRPHESPMLAPDRGN